MRTAQVIVRVRFKLIVLILARKWESHTSARITNNSHSKDKRNTNINSTSNRRVEEMVAWKLVKP